MSAVSLLKSREQHHIKVINKNFFSFYQALCKMLADECLWHFSVCLFYEWWKLIHRQWVFTAVVNHQCPLKWTSVCGSMCLNVICYEISSHWQLFLYAFCPVITLCHWQDVLYTTYHLSCNVLSTWANYILTIWRGRVKLWEKWRV